MSIFVYTIVLVTVVAMTAALIRRVSSGAPGGVFVDTSTVSIPASRPRAAPPCRA
ncbi:hypothetical protein GCM10027280_26450 [Micromonospora polyrhachis]|uniref:Uncharacterized protein n=1 Tax=Micromonospora polyrhachis TaxID=1282883 RepID=A0A7W7WND4_9ACTN|nr:hypothetical protein [Micromonospora polyrhachis]MBB4957740.1 hypothetical protein [Micromonospora polyrhachis]